MLSRINAQLPQPQALCLTPTRELAVQIVTDAVKPLSSRLPHITYELALPGRDINGGTMMMMMMMLHVDNFDDEFIDG